MRSNNSTPARSPGFQGVASSTPLIAGAILSALCLLSGCRKDVGAQGLVESEALASPSRGGERLFHALSPKESGIDFQNVLLKEHHKKYLLNGSGVCVGDFDGDSRPDIYFVSQDGANRLYRQVGDLVFEDVTSRAGVDGGDAMGAGASFADVDNDGDLDLFVCNIDGPDLLYINQGNGTFKESAEVAGVASPGASTMASFADYDRDGDLDLYLVTYRLYSAYEEAPVIHYIEIDGKLTIRPDQWEHWALMSGHYVEAGQKDILFRNNGDGTFTDVSGEAGIRGYDLGLSATWWDYNDDGWPDIYVANDLKSSDHLYRNNGDGTFTDVIEETVPHTTWFSMGADSADINNDGLFDLMVGDMSSTTHFMQKTTMGAMGWSGWFLDSAEPRQYMRNTLYLNTGTDRLMEVAYLTGLANTDWTWSIKFGDLDNDGRVDVFVSNGMEKNVNDSDWTTKWERLMEQGRTDEASRLIHERPRQPEVNLAFRNLGDFEFENVGARWGLDFRGVTHGAAFADLDRDGDLDIVINNLHDPAIIYRNDSQSEHRILIRLVGTQSNRFGVGAKVTLETKAGLQVRQLTLARGYLSQDEPLIHFGLGESDRVSRLTVEWPSGVEQVVKNLRADRFYTITEPASASRPSPPKTAPYEGQFVDTTGETGLEFVHTERSFDDYEREPLLPYKLSQLGPGIAWGDADGDGDDDLFVGGAAGQPGALFIRGEDGKFVKASGGPWNEDAACEDMACLWFDADGDGDQDLFVVSGGNESGPGDRLLRDRLYLNDGSGFFAKAPEGVLPPFADSGSVAAACDFDRDGDLDLFVGARVIPGKYPETPNSRLLRNDGGKFVDVSDRLAPGLRRIGLVTGAVWSDANGDGWPDLLIAVEWGSVRLFVNAQGKLSDATEEAGLAGHTGWWNGIAAGDVDGDGDMDFVATNAGLNTKYIATPQYPARLYANDFDRDGRLDLVESMFEHGTEYPVRGRSCSSNAMPFVADKFETYREFALATTQDIYTPEKLSKSLDLSANFLESAVFINQGDGTYEVRPLPRFAQASPGYGVSITDFNGDGVPDIYIVQNFFAPQRETGRWDGGLSVLLEGLGNGEFAPVWPKESALVVPEDAKGMAVADINDDGWPDLAVGANSGRLRVFRNRGIAGNKLLKLRLEGRPGNPTAVGAKVTVLSQKGAKQTAEVYAGSGYLSQSTSCLFFGFGKDDRPVEVRVLWPDGETAMFTEGLDARTVTLRQK
ncbi:MAG: VCBS repeat-containing protein [Armatimonadetes bacterium]|nr:VCBS repeat-containing protein [Armatimonadota bacterium]